MGIKIAILGFLLLKLIQMILENHRPSTFVRSLLEEGAILKIHDPKVSKRQISLNLGMPSD